MSLRFGSGRSKPEVDPAQATVSDAEDLDLVRQIQSGNRDALTTLFNKYSGMVFGIARRMLKNSGEAEEVVQQVFLDTYKAIRQFDPKKAPYKTWLFQFAYHRAMNRKKHLEAKGFYSSEELIEEQLPVELFEGAGRPLQLYSQDVARLVQQLLKSLKPEQRVAIELTFFHGFRAEEIAQKTGDTPAAVRHHLYRGIDKLRVALFETKSAEKEKSKVKEKVKEMEGLVVDPAQLL